MYSTDFQVPFKLGSPVNTSHYPGGLNPWQSKPAAAATAAERVVSEQSSYRIPSWRYETLRHHQQDEADDDQGEEIGGTVRLGNKEAGKSVDFAMVSSAAAAGAGGQSSSSPWANHQQRGVTRKSMVASRFSVATTPASLMSEFGPSMLQSRQKYVSSGLGRSHPVYEEEDEYDDYDHDHDYDHDYDDAFVGDNERYVANRYRDGRMEKVSRNSTQRRFERGGTIRLGPTGRRGEGRDAGGGGGGGRGGNDSRVLSTDDRVTQVYKLLKRALGR